MHGKPRGAQPQLVDDPLYDPVAIAFIYGAWAGVSWATTPMIGLMVLVAATALLTVHALGTTRSPAPRPFLTEFATILLFCAAAIGLGVLGIELAATSTTGVLGASLAAISGGAAMLADAR